MLVLPDAKFSFSTLLYGHFHLLNFILRQIFFQGLSRDVTMKLYTEIFELDIIAVAEDRPLQPRNVSRHLGPLSMPQNNGARAYSFQSSSVSYGGPNGTYYSSSATRRMGPEGVSIYPYFLELFLIMQYGYFCCSSCVDKVERKPVLLQCPSIEIYRLTVKYLLSVMVTGGRGGVSREGFQSWS